MITSLYIILFGIYLALKLNRTSVINGIKVSFLSGSLIATYAIFQSFGIDPLFVNLDTDIFAGRVFSFLGNPGYLGQFLMIVLILGLYLFKEQKNVKNKLILAIPICLIIFALLLSRTRAAIFALFICLVILIFRNYKIILKKILFTRRIWKVMTFMLLFLVLIFFVTWGVPETNFSGMFSTRSLQSRIQIWDGAVEFIKQKPILGYGQDTFYIYAPQIANKQLLTLEEDISFVVDRIHNEFLETVFSFGVFAGLLYLVFFGFLMKIFFTENDRLQMFLSLALIGNIVQNQFGFPDLTILVVTCFLIASLVALRRNGSIFLIYKISGVKKILPMMILILASFFVFKETIYRQYMSEILYAKSYESYSTDYNKAVITHKEALSYAPYYSESWYRLMMIDPSSMATALSYLEEIEGESGNVLAWKGNLYSSEDPATASYYYMRALEKNPYYPNWIRSYADMLYKNGDLESAYYLYLRYLESCPDFWRWGNTVYDKSEEEQKSYRIFFKNNPTFWDTVERVYLLEEMGVNMLEILPEIR